jgi:RNA polymerase sigma-70 factor, ECF subfamily
MFDRSDDAVRVLARRVCAGDVAAFESLFHLLHAPLCEVVDSYVRSQSIAEEIVQELFMTVWLKRSRWQLTRSPRAYLFGAARNRALHHLRHRAVVRRSAELVGSDPSVAGVARGAVGPDRQLEQREAAVALRAAVDRLPVGTRLAWVLRSEHEMSYAEVATAMGISPKGVEKLVATATAKLRAALSDHASSDFVREKPPR